MLFGCKDESELLTLAPEDIYAEYQPDGRLSSEKAPEMVDAVFQQGSLSFEWKYKRKDGTEFLAAGLWTKMGLEGQEILLSTIRDITEQRRAEEALRASERRLRLFADNVTDVIWRMDLSGRFTYLSPSVEQLLGIKWNEDIAMTVADLMSPTSLPSAKETLEKIAIAAQRGTTCERQQGIRVAPAGTA